MALRSDEGILKWVQIHELFHYEMPATAKQMLGHWSAGGRFTQEVYGGVTDGKTGTFAEMTLF